MPEKAISHPRPVRPMRWIVTSIVVVAVLIGAYTGIRHMVRQHVTGLIEASEQKPLPDFVLTDTDGDVSAPATVTIVVDPLNDPPIGIQERTFSMIENGTLIIDAVNGVLLGGYDVDGKLLDAMGNEIGSPMNAVLTTLPASGVLTFDGATGAFTYVAAINFTGEVTFTYRLFDGVDLSVGSDYVVRIVVNPAPPPAAVPNPGEVSITFNISDVPLEQASSVPDRKSTRLNSSH